jgi:hypothetical protein
LVGEAEVAIFGCVLTFREVGERAGTDGKNF